MSSPLLDIVPPAYSMFPGSYTVSSPIQAINYRDWFIRKHMEEVMMRYRVDNNIGYPRILMYERWRCEPKISVWTCLDTIPYNMKGARKPKPQELEYDAVHAYERTDKDKVKQLYEMWHHECKDPYYCPMHGFGSD